MYSNLKHIHNSLWCSKYSQLSQPDNVIQAMYVWIDGRQLLRAKTRTLNFVPKSVSDLPLWTTDGHSIFITEDNAEIYLEPVRIYNDPFRCGNNILVLCQTLYDDFTITKSNSRYSSNAVMDMAADQKPLFGIEQEYTLLHGDDRGIPLGWPTGGFPGPQGPYHCGVGAYRVFGRDIVEAHYRACMYAGIAIAGENAEAMPGQWEYQIGPCPGIKIGDDLWMSRFILHRVAEDFHVGVTFEPKLIAGDWNGSGAHVNFSTEKMRQKGGLTEIKSACEKLKKNHAKHMTVYDQNGGADNVRRLTGKHETSSIDQCDWAIADRYASIRIPRQVANDGYGYLEDRRPAANIDPYVVCEMIVRTICLNE